MGTRRRNRPVSTTVASGSLTLDTGLPDAQPAKPRARDPPSPAPRESPALPAGPAGVPRQTRQGKTSPHPRPKGRGDAPTSPLPTPDSQS